jgi:two-component system cell cycle response regulator DivK
MNGRVLIADDDFDNRVIAQEALEASGYEVDLATNGQETLEQVAQRKPDVLLLDLSMPKVNGWEVAKRIREMPAMASAVIIAFTAHALVGDELKAKAAGCDDYLSKPCLPKEIVDKVAFWVAQRRTATPNEAAA